MKLGKKADHFICKLQIEQIYFKDYINALVTVESTGVLSSRELVLEAIKVLKEKCQQKLRKLEHVEPTNTQNHSSYSRAH